MSLCREMEKEFNFRGTKGSPMTPPCRETVGKPTVSPTTPSL